MGTWRRPAASEPRLAMSHTYVQSCCREIREVSFGKCALLRLRLFPRRVAPRSRFRLAQAPHFTPKFGFGKLPPSRARSQNWTSQRYLSTTSETINSRRQLRRFRPGHARMRRSQCQSPGRRSNRASTPCNTLSIPRPNSSNNKSLVGLLRCRTSAA